MSTSSKQVVEEAQVITEENGAGALAPMEQRKNKRKHSLGMDDDEAFSHGDGPDIQEVRTPVEKSMFAMPPPPPPPTPVQAPVVPTTMSAATSAAAAASETDDEANSEKWEDPCAPPPPPPLPTPAGNKFSASYVKMTAIKLKDALEEAITKMETNKRGQQQEQQQRSKVEVSRKSEKKELQQLTVIRTIAAIKQILQQI